MKMESTIRLINIDSIIPNRFQPRLVFEEESLQELASSIQVHGIIEPLVLRRVGDKYEIIAGERRCKAATMAGLTAVPAIIAELGDNESAEVAIIENTHRKAMSSIEEAQAFKKLLDRKYVTQDQLARRLGTSQSNIANKLRLLNLDNNVQQALLKEQISERHARALLKLTDKMKQVELVNRIIQENLTVRELEGIVNQIVGGYKQAPLAGGIRTNNNVDINIDDMMNNSIDIEVDPSIPLYHYNPNSNASTEEKKKSLFLNNLENENVNMDASLEYGFNPFKTPYLKSEINKPDYDTLDEHIDDDYMSGIKINQSDRISEDDDEFEGLDEYNYDENSNNYDELNEQDTTLRKNVKIKTVFVEKEKEYTSFEEVIDGIKYIVNNAKLNGISLNLEEFDFDKKIQFIVRVDK